MSKPGISLSHSTSSPPNTSSLRNLVKARNTVKFGGNLLTVVNFGTIGFQGYYEYTEEGKIRNSTIADFTITLALTALSFSPLAPLGWTLSLIYGGIRLFKGDNIDNWFNKFQIW